MPARSLIISVVVTTAVAGCATSEEATTTTAPGTTTTAAATAGDDTTTTAADITTTTEVAAGGADCVVGSWVIDSDAFLESLRDVFADEATGGEVTEINGIYAVEMAADGTFTGERDEWGFTVLTAEGTVEIAMDGTETGTWSAAEDNITVETNTSAVNVSVTVTSGDQVFTLTDSPVDIPDVITSAAEYTCAGDVLTVTSDDVQFVLTRV